MSPFSSRPDPRPIREDYIGAASFHRAHSEWEWRRGVRLARRRRALLWTAVVLSAIGTLAAHLLRR